MQFVCPRCEKEKSAPAKLAIVLKREKENTFQKCFFIYLPVYLLPTSSSVFCLEASSHCSCLLAHPTLLGSRLIISLTFDR